MQDPATRIDFYVLESTAPSARLNFVCRLCEKAYLAGHRVFLLTRSKAQSGELDKLLWTFRDDAFVPHQQTESGQPAAAAIIIGNELPGSDANDSGTDVLINLQDTVPAMAERFQRVAEVIDGSEQVRGAGRKRFSDYKQAGFAPQTHKIGNGQAQ